MEHTKINKECATTTVYSTKNPDLADPDDRVFSNFGKIPVRNLQGSIKEARSAERKRVKGNSKQSAYFNGKCWLNQTTEKSKSSNQKATRRTNQSHKHRGQQRPLVQVEDEPEVHETATDKVEVQYDVYHPCSRTSALAYPVQHRRQFQDGALPHING